MARGKYGRGARRRRDAGAVFSSLWKYSQRFYSKAWKTKKPAIIAGFLVFIQDADQGVNTAVPLGHRKSFCAAVPLKFVGMAV